jgi:hypothetical protein
LFDKRPLKKQKTYDPSLPSSVSGFTVFPIMLPSMITLPYDSQTDVHDSVDQKYISICLLAITYIFSDDTAAFWRSLCLMQSLNLEMAHTATIQIYLNKFVINQFALHKL